MEQQLSVVLFSATDDRMAAAASMIEGAAAAGTRVRVLLQFWALKDFVATSISQPHGVSAEAAADGVVSMAHYLGREGRHWSEALSEARAIGDVAIFADVDSMELFSLSREDLVPFVDGVLDAVSFIDDARGELVHV